VQQHLASAPAQAVSTLPELDEAQFQRWAELLRVRTGMRVPPERKSFLATGLGLRMREIGCECLDEYFERLTSGSGAMVEWSTLVDRLTVHETRFFRHPDSMDLVDRQVRGKAPDPDTGTVRFEAWSAGCATGEEAYTLAMVIDRALAPRRQDGARAYFGVIATDISQPALRAAREGVYHVRRLKDVPEEVRQSYFEPIDDQHARVCESIRRRVCFACSNVLDAGHEPFGALDLIYCQNLLIYFERSRRAEIVEAMVTHLRPGGLLVLGSGELMGWSDSRMELVPHPQTCAYRRLG